LGDDNIESLKQLASETEWIRNPPEQLLSDENHRRLLNYLNFRARSRKHGLAYLLDYDNSVDLASIASDCYSVGVCATYRCDDRLTDQKHLYNLAKKSAIFRMETIREYYHCESRRPMDETVELTPRLITTYTADLGNPANPKISDMAAFLASATCSTTTAVDTSYTYRRKVSEPSERSSEHGTDPAHQDWLHLQKRNTDIHAVCVSIDTSENVELRSVLERLPPPAQRVCALVSGLYEDPTFDNWLELQASRKKNISDKSLFLLACRYYEITPDSVRDDLSRLIHV
jgi:hypothetical protein